MDNWTVQDFLLFFGRWWKRFAVAALVVLVLTPILCIFLPKKYDAVTTLVSTSSSGGRLGGISAAGEGLAALGGMLSVGASSEDRLWNVVSSKSVGSKVVEDLDLGPKIMKDRWDFEKGQWKNPKNPPRSVDVFDYMRREEIVEFEEDERGLLSIVVRADDPILSADIANGYVVAIQEFINERTFSQSKKNRRFLEKQLLQVAGELAEVEADLRVFSERHGIISLDVQTELTLGNIATIESEIRSLEIQIGFIRKQSGGVDSPEVRRLRDQKTELEKQARLLTERTLPSKSMEKKKAKEDSLAIKLKALPELSMGFLKLKRDLLIKEKVYVLLTEQLELARIEEIKEDMAFQVVDAAYSPRSYSYPKPVLFTVAAIFLVTVLAMALALVVEYFEQTGLIKDREDLAPKVQRDISAA